MEETRVRVFRALKPPCVELSQVALKHKTKKATGKDVIKSLENLHTTLSDVSIQADALNPKLADYVFFPLSHIFRDVKELPVRAVEVALNCLQILISKGWKIHISPDMGKQLLILLCFIAGGSPTEAKVKGVHEEVGAAAFECLTSLFEASKTAGLGRERLIKTEDVPILGHTVMVMVDGLVDGPSVKVRLAALRALDIMIEGLSDLEALKNVFPGIVSSLTKVLSSKSQSKPSYKTLVIGLDTLRKILCKAIGDHEYSGSEYRSHPTSVSTRTDNASNNPWIEATAGQIKMALANIMPLRYHERDDVQDSLSRLCIAIIQHCQKSLHESIAMVVETLVVLCSHASQRNAVSTYDLGNIFASDTELLEMLKASLHNWVVTLPRLMQSNDDTRKRRIVDQISTSFKILEEQDVSLDILSDTVASNLRASVTAAIQASGSKTISAVSESSLEVTQMIQPAQATAGPGIFSPVLFNRSGDTSSMAGLTTLAQQLKALPTSTGLQQGMIDTLWTTSGNEQLAALWLCLQTLSSDADVMDQYLNLVPVQETQQRLLDDVYAFSLDVLAKYTFDDKERWELQALALEAVALQARQQNQDFRPELVDALYPILERLGSNIAGLQQHAMNCLNLVSNACEYSSSAALIIDNADYVVNAVALKLNTFNISPQAPQVLVTMVRLCGSALIPYLDDLVESVFSILACYHGYPKLVESLFSVLNAIVEEASRGSTKLIQSKSEELTHPRPYQPSTMADISSLLRANLQRSTQPLSPPTSPPPSPPPEPTTQEPSHSDPDPDTVLPPADPPPPTPSKTQILLTSITNLTPSHLTTPSPPLRSHILRLLTTVLPLLATVSSTFLPIAATLYPAIAARLYDNEPYVVLAAANALTALCACAGDFLATRIEAEMPKLQKLYWKAEKEMREEVRAMGGRRGGMRWRSWDGVVGLVVGCVRDVGVGGVEEDGVFEMLGGWVGEGGGLMERGREVEVRDVLGGVNADWLWLVVEERRGRRRVERTEDRWAKPMLEGWEFRDVVF